MIPTQFLKVEPHHKVLDMCAARIEDVSGFRRCTEILRVTSELWKFWHEWRKSRVIGENADWFCRRQRRGFEAVYLLTHQRNAEFAVFVGD